VITSDDGLANLQRQNDIIISLLARMIWTPTQVAEIVSRGKRDPEAYRRVYNALDEKTTGTSLAATAGVKQQTLSAILQDWKEEGIVVNVGTDSPRYRRLMSIQVKANKKGKTAQNGDGK
jgi:hypothetical protein